ncbi:MAG: phosphoserine transaminase [Syntrophales bacterium]|nr:phosphoserine transaminase [Syntrophales bacterium]
MHNPNFSSGPCSKRPGWQPNVLKDALVGRSHRSEEARAKLKKAIMETKRILGIPDTFHVGIMPGSDTGAFEAAMWNLLGPLPVTVLVWESFSEEWARDCEEQLKLNPRILKAEYGKIPDLWAVDWTNDVVFVANGTTSGVKIPHWEWIPADRKGLAICDATSAVFAMPVDWSKVDALTFSWQKCLGGEAAHGILVLSPRAVERINTYDPPWPIPKVFRIKKNEKLDVSIFEGNTINTPSMLCVEDYLDALAWGSTLGLEGLIARSEANLRVVEEWVARNHWITFLAESSEIRSNTSVCLTIRDEKIARLSDKEKMRFLQEIADELGKKKIAYDIMSYRDAPPGFRFWCGPTVEPDDIRRALENLESIYLEKISQQK